MNKITETYPPMELPLFQRMLERGERPAGMNTSELVPELLSPSIALYNSEFALPQQRLVETLASARRFDTYLQECDISLQEEDLAVPPPEEPKDDFARYYDPQLAKKASRLQTTQLAKERLLKERRKKTGFADARFQLVWDLSLEKTVARKTLAVDTASIAAKMSTLKGDREDLEERQRYLLL